MVETTVVYHGDLHCQATHTPSGATIETDAPVDNQGKGEAFSPTDLVATALGTCILTICGILARRLEMDIQGAAVSVKKEMTTEPPRRIARLQTTVRMPARISPADRQRFENAARTCPVHRSLHPEIDAPIEFEWV